MNSRQEEGLLEAYLSIYEDATDRQQKLDDLRKASAQATMAGPSREAQALMSDRTKRMLGANKLRAGIEGQEKVERMKVDMDAPKPAPAPTAPKPMDDFSAGGGNAKMKKTGMTRDQVVALGKKNLAAKPATSQQTPPAAPTLPKPDSVSLSSDQEALYNKAHANRGNFLARGQIQSALTKMSPEQRKQFKDYAKQRGHEKDWGDYKFESYVLEYLVAEGYADTNKAALAIMANMSEGWKQDIVEVLGGQPGDGYIGHPRLGIKNPLNPPKKSTNTAPQNIGLAGKLGNRASELENAINKLP